MTFPTIRIVTIGVYGFDEPGFFQAIQLARVDTFIDIRQRRGMRGSKYAFANSTFLQAQLRKLEIRYIHFKALAPPSEIRQLQKDADQLENTLKSERFGLSQTFVRAYQTNILDHFEPEALFTQLPSDCRVAALFCVESQPAACHRSLVAAYFSIHYGYKVEDIIPWKS